MPTLQFGTAKAAPGEKSWGVLNVREGNQRVRIGVAVINGAQEGEHVVAVANQHGAEVNGVESLRLFVEQVDPRKLKGSVFVVPSANPRAALLFNEFYPEDADETTLAKYQGGRYREPGHDRHACPYNMNRRWPGAKGGLLVDRMVYEIWNRAVMAPHRKASLFLDYHCHQSPTAIYAKFREDVDLGIVSGSPAVIYTRSAVNAPDRPYSRIACWRAGIQALTVELGGQRAMVPRSIEDGRRIMVNLLRFWGMLPDKMEYWPEPTVVLDPWRNDVVQRTFTAPSYAIAKAGHRGLVVQRKWAFDRVRNGELVCHIVDPHTGEIAAAYSAGMSGVIMSAFRTDSLCQKGEHLFTVSQARWVNPAEHAKKVDVEKLRGAGAKWTP